MAEYIKRETFLKDIEERYCLPCKEAGKDHNGFICHACWVDAMRVDVIDAPAADVAPVVHGRWIEQEDPMLDVYYTCSVCKEDFYIETTGYTEKDMFLYTYCPNCGAKMDGGNENDR